MGDTISINEEDLLFRWTSKHDLFGVTPRELYMRQNGLCGLVLENGRLCCTDGTDTAFTASMLNPTIECVRCMVGFFEKKE